MSIKKNLPIGAYSLGNMVANGYLYIDKTELAHKLITTNNRYFLARPRRFGKSLLVSTFKEIFSGNKELFSELWIGQEGRYTWQQYPVLLLDFSGVNSQSPSRLEESLCNALDRAAKAHDCSVFKSSIPGDKLTNLVLQLSARGPVVLLIDEYDSPIVSNMAKKEVALANRDVLREFYKVVKALDEHLRFLFITGVSKFSKTSVFSGLNNLQDISVNTDVAAICGYTQEELHINLSQYVDEFAQFRKCDSQVIWDEMKAWYNGYRFSQADVKVYNPFSVFCYLDNKDLRNYWFATGTPKFLVDMIKRDPKEFFKIPTVKLSASSLDAFEVDSLPLSVLLYQTGYLTFESYQADRMAYTMAYPNEEVRRSFNECLVAGFLSVTPPQANSIFNQLRDALYDEELGSFCEHLQSLLAQIPYHIQNAHADEAYYHSIFLVAGMAIGFAQAEVATSHGRIDLLLRTPHGIFIFEFKCNRTAHEALAQIKDRGYATGYLGEGKKVFAIGVNVNVPGNEFVAVWEEVLKKP